MLLAANASYLYEPSPMQETFSQHGDTDGLVF